MAVQGRDVHVAANRALPRSLYAAACCLLAAMALCFAVELIPRQLLGLHVQADNSPVYTVYFPDLLLFARRFAFFHSANFFTYHGEFPFMYPAPVAVPYKLFYFFGSHTLAAFLFFAGVSFVLAALAFSRVLLRHGVALSDAYAFPLCVLLCSYPVWFAGNQGNMEIVIWAVMTAGLALFMAGRGYSAAACFGIAAAMKIYPLVYLGLFLSRKQIREPLFGLVVMAGATVSSLWLVCPDLKTSSRGIAAGLDMFRSLYMVRVRPEIGADHSLFAFLKLRLHPEPDAMALGHLLTIYLACAAVFGVALYVVRIRHLPITNQVLCLTIASILFPPTSFEYTLLHLFFPLGMLVLVLVQAQRGGERLPGATLALGCFVVLLAFLPELIFHGMHYGGQIKTLALVVLFAVALARPFAIGAGDGLPQSPEYAG